MYFDFHKNMNADINLLTRIISNGTDGKYGFCDSTQMGQFIGQFIFLSVRSIPLTLSWVNIKIFHLIFFLFGI